MQVSPLKNLLSASAPENESLFKPTATAKNAQGLEAQKSIVSGSFDTVLNALLGKRAYVLPAQRIAYAKDEAQLFLKHANESDIETHEESDTPISDLLLPIVEEQIVEFSEQELDALTMAWGKLNTAVPIESADVLRDHGFKHEAPERIFEKNTQSSVLERPLLGRNSQNDIPQRHSLNLISRSAETVLVATPIVASENSQPLKNGTNQSSNVVVSTSAEAAESQNVPALLSLPASTENVHPSSQNKLRASKPVESLLQPITKTVKPSSLNTTYAQAEGLFRQPLDTAKTSNMAASDRIMNGIIEVETVGEPNVQRHVFHLPMAENLKPVFRETSEPELFKTINETSVSSVQRSIPNENEVQKLRYSEPYLGSANKTRAERTALPESASADIRRQIVSTPFTSLQFVPLLVQGLTETKEIQDKALPENAVIFSATPSSEISTGNRTSFNPATHMPELPKHVSRQMMTALKASPDGTIELHLNPVELGRVRMNMTTTEAGIVMNILAERPETLELLRRNVEQLVTDFQSLGYSQSEFHFGRSGRERESRQKDHAIEIETESAQSDAMNHSSVSPQNSSVINLDRVDIRL